PRAAAGLRQRARQEGQNFIVVPHRLANGDVRTVEVHSSPVQVKGRQLLFSIIHDVTERKLLEKEILDIGETERQRIGQDLHDSLGGMLTGVALMSKALARQLEAKGIAEAATAGEIVSCINNAVTQTRTISRGLFPEELSAAGLVEGLREFAGETAKRSGIACNFEASKGALIHDQSVAAHLFRIAQEAVNNALRHSEASQVKIRLAQRARLPAAKGLGLRTMKYRADIIGAQFAIKPGDPRGTVISCQLAPDAALPPKSGKC
ncbi:MAG: histidine kinase, partial [Verrucomicrobia bacterium]|nr:histidine kinase [Verrucomicrobiota bacterium]